jgi:amino acid transporter
MSFFKNLMGVQESSTPEEKIISGVSVLITFWFIILIIQLSLVALANIPDSEIDNNEDDITVSNELIENLSGNLGEYWVTLGYILFLVPALVHIYALSLISRGIREIFNHSEKD